MRLLLGLDRRKVARQQTRLQRSLTIQYQRPLAAEIHRASMAMLDGMLTSGAVQYLPPDHEPRIAAIYLAMANSAISTFGARILEDGKARHLHDLESKGFAELFMRLAREYIGGEAIRKRITAVAETTRSQIIRMVDRGQESGASIDDIAKDLARISPRISRTRGAMIARTETHGAANYGTHEAAKATGLVLMKEWVSVQDTRVRDFNEPTLAEYDHRRMDGQTVAMDAPFLVPTLSGGKEPLMFPGDPNGRPGNIINCRCQSVHVIPGLDDAAAPLRPRAVNRTRATAQSVPRTVAEMETFVVSNGIATSAELKGLSAKTVGPTLLVAAEIKRRFGLDPIIGIGPASRFGLPTPRNTNAAIYRVRSRDTGRRGVFHMPIKFGSEKDATAQVEMARKNAPRYGAEREKQLQLPHISDDVRLRAARIDAESSLPYTWSMSSEAQTGADARARTMAHEFGHVIHLQNTANPEMGKAIDDWLSIAQPRRNGWGYLLSKYSHANDREYVAEAFTVYAMLNKDQHYRIHPGLLRIFEQWDSDA